ncbi:hypothetical protein BT96DRAFT_1027491 [Gymnopus androsaceus JB14]|uniref:Uncharacterized protein n=1 Tax=Gymnopus androsaceus JB14 TaxID=1447944 RepID=A0A6A4GBG5_9AGAR|nr:hypothetical protein BT96DRAFT_1027491 [Gymnopus androsaceus JB14]
MQENIYTCFRVFSLFAIFILDASKPFMNPLVTSIANAALIVFIPSSVGVSLWLHRTMLGRGPILPLAFSVTNGTRAVFGRNTEGGQLRTLLTFVHAWLMLSRFLGAISESSSNPSPATSQWASVGLTFTLLSVIVFGRCLLVLGIREENWGYFLPPYLMILFCLKIGIYIVQTVFDMLKAGQVAVETFRSQRENAG